MAIERNLHGWRLSVGDERAGKRGGCRSRRMGGWGGVCVPWFVCAPACSPHCMPAPCPPLPIVRFHHGRGAHHALRNRLSPRFFATRGPLPARHSPARPLPGPLTRHTSRIRLGIRTYGRTGKATWMTRQTPPLPEEGGMLRGSASAHPQPHPGTLCRTVFPHNI